MTEGFEYSQQHHQKRMRLRADWQNEIEKAFNRLEALSCKNVEPVKFRMDPSPNTVVSISVYEKSLPIPCKVNGYNLEALKNEKQRAEVIEDMVKHLPAFTGEDSQSGHRHKDKYETSCQDQNVVPDEMVLDLESEDQDDADISSTPWEEPKEKWSIDKENAMSVDELIKQEQSVDDTLDEQDEHESSDGSVYSSNSYKSIDDFPANIIVSSSEYSLRCRRGDISYQAQAPRKIFVRTDIKDFEQSEIQYESNSDQEKFLIDFADTKLQERLESSTNNTLSRSDLDDIDRSTLKLAKGLAGANGVHFSQQEISSGNCVHQQSDGSWCWLYIGEDQKLHRKVLKSRILWEADREFARFKAQIDHRQCNQSTISRRVERAVSKIMVASQGRKAVFHENNFQWW